MLRRIPALKEELRVHARDHKVLSVVATAAAPSLLGLWGVIAPSAWSFSPVFCAAVTALLLIVQFGAAWLLLDRPTTFGPALVALADAQEKLDQHTDDAIILHRARELLFQAHNWALILHTFQPAALALPASSGIEGRIKRVLTPFPPDPQTLFDLRSTDLWSFAVYLYDKDVDLLRCVWHRVHPKHPSAGRAPRDWRPGAGHVGQAFLDWQAWEDGTGLITPDATMPENRKRFAAPGNASRDYDLDIYQSFASLPFGRFDPAARPTGVLVGTSNRVGTFDDWSALPLRHLATVFGTLSLQESNRERT